MIIQLKVWRKICRVFVYLCYHPYLVSLLFAILLSLHLVTLLCFFSTYYGSCDGPNIIESVDSNVGIAQTHNIWQYKKSLKISKTVSLGLAFITTYHSSSSVLMTNNTHSGVRKHRESTKPGTRKTGQMFFFLLSFFFFFFLQTG